MKNQLTPDQLADRIEMLEEAQFQLKEAITMIMDALHGTDEEAHAEAYIIPHLKSWLYKGHFNTSIEDYIENLKNSMEEVNDEL